MSKKNVKNKCEMVFSKYLIIFSFFVTFSNPLIPIAYAEEWVAACEENYPPYNYIENGEIVGLDAEIVLQVMKKLRKQVKIETYPWAKVYSKLLDNQIDFAWQFVGTQERKELFHLVGPIRYGIDVILVRTDSNVSNWVTLNDFSGMKVGVIKGYKYHHEFDSANNFKKVEYSNIVRQFEGLINRKVDFIIGDFNVFRYFLRKNNLSDKIKFLPSSIKKIPRFIAFSNKNKAKAVLFDHYLQEFLKSPEYIELLEKYDKMMR